MIQAWSVLIFATALFHVWFSTVGAVIGNGNAFGNKINTCLFDNWIQKQILTAKMDCGGRQLKGLCYGPKPQQTLFAVCYNTNTRIPEFTGHVVFPAEGDGRDSNWRKETGPYAPDPQSDVAVDYEKFAQRQVFGETFNDQNNFYCSRGHLTPNADFSSAELRSLTMINTNVAPQWQSFNGGNWAAIETAVQRFTETKKRDLYVVTGTGGAATNPTTGANYMLNGLVLVPKYYWKAVCDPVGGQSIVFLAQNPAGVTSTTKIGGCNGVQQTENRGIVYCYSLDSMKGKEGAEGFKLPAFSEKCTPSKQGTFLNDYLGNLS